MTLPHAGNGVTKALVIVLPRTGIDSGNVLAKLKTVDLLSKMRLSERRVEFI